MNEFLYFSEETKEKIEKFYDLECKKYDVFPPKNAIFRAFDLCPFNNLKVVIIGQDPYSNINQANGLAFSVNKGIKLPPSLKNIFKEIEYEFGDFQKNEGDLTYLCNQGVLLINAILTVREHKPMSHDNNLYRQFFNEVISNIEKNNNCIIYMLWGTKAKKFKRLITNKNHFVIETNHPSPLSANRGGWFHENQFKKCNEILKNHFLEEINWKFELEHLEKK